MLDVFLAVLLQEKCTDCADGNHLFRPSVAALFMARTVLADSWLGGDPDLSLTISQTAKAPLCCDRSRCGPLLSKYARLEWRAPS